MNGTTETQDDPTASAPTLEEELPRRWGWLLALGLLMIFTGTLGLWMAFYLTLASVIVFGSFMLAGGVLQLIQGFQSGERAWGGRLQHLLIALLYIVTGGLIVYDPLTASTALTLVLAGLFGAMGALRIYHALRYRRHHWGWVAPMSAGLIDIALAAIIVVQWPVSGLWVIGVLVAVEMIMNGWLLTLIALAARKGAHAETRQPQAG